MYNYNTINFYKHIKANGRDYEHSYVRKRSVAGLRKRREYMRYKINYKSKVGAAAYAALNTACMCILYGTLIFALSAGVAIWIFDADIINTRVVISFCAAAIAVFSAIMIYYLLSEKYAELTPDSLIIKTGYYEFGTGSYFKFTNKLSLSNISECKYIRPENEGESICNPQFKINDRVRFKISAGDYSKPYIEIIYDIGHSLLLPVENAEQLYNELSAACKRAGQ